ncbi:DUF5671 domain-containing protein [Salinibacterium sp. ZJ454]|uniref:DUF5671 domain-containing protein n=1 Tax=Salinibacterium sp. ZJ454 TaxID=2708339 RepID=UPI001FBC0686|nr:DUF5671 domain-containing protein [Salinibacterium sp. ZJ454]
MSDLPEHRGDHVTALPEISDSSAGSAQRTVRRLVVYILLFALVVTAAIGLSGLLERLLGSTEVIVGGGSSQLARSFAFTLVAGPLAAILWWFVWKRLDDRAERSSLAWGLYLAGMYTVSLITFTTALLGTVASLIEGDWRPGDLATGLVWAAVWGWHRWMLRHPGKAPTRLSSVPDVVGFTFGLAVGVGGAITALSSLLDEAILGSAGAGAVGDPWWQPVLQSLVWAVGGAIVWWWHWVRSGARRLRTVLSDVAVIGFGVLIPSILTLGGIGVVLWVLLRLGFDRSEPNRVLLEPLAPAIAAALVGALVWFYHRAVLPERSDVARQAARLITSGVALVFAASGVGVIVNATLGAVTPTLAGTDTRTLLLGGISSLIVGAPVWWLFWRGTDTLSPARRVYLIVVFGLSAVVALIALLVIGFRIFEFLFDVEQSGSLLDRVRAPFGLLVATALVSGYHFSIWRRDRAAIAAATPVRPRTIGHVTLVTAGDSEAAVRLIRDATGAAVTVWRRTDVAASVGAGAGAGPGAGADAAQLVRALDGVTGDEVFVLVGPGTRIEVVPAAR